MVTAAAACAAGARHLLAHSFCYVGTLDLKLSRSQPQARFAAAFNSQLESNEDGTASFRASHTRLANSACFLFATPANLFLVSASSFVNASHAASSSCSLADWADESAGAAGTAESAAESAAGAAVVEGRESSGGVEGGESANGVLALANGELTCKMTVACSGEQHPWERRLLNRFEAV